MAKLDKSNVYVIKYVEIFLVIVAVLALYFALVKFAPGGLISTDITWYMNVGLNGIKDTFILNRYFHVFLEAIFIRFAASPLAGLQNYWAFLISGTTLLVYLAARNLTSHNTPLHGILAVALFFSTGVVAETAGSPLVDNTAMFMVLLFIAAFLASARKKHESKYLLVLLGSLFFLAFKTKETTLPIGILFFGLSISDEGFDWRLFARRLGYVFVGIGAGIIFFIFLNWIFLGDPFFGMRIENISRFMGTYVASTQDQEKYSGTGNWYTSYILAALWIPFTLYLISGVKPNSLPRNSRGIRLIWLLPLLSIMFVTIAIGSKYEYLPRFVYPAVPVMCLLGPQFLNLDLRTIANRRRRITALAVFLGGLLVMVLIRTLMKPIFQNKGWDVTTFMAAVFIPILFSTILALVFFWRKIPLPVSYLIAVLIIAIAIIPISHNLKQIVINQPNRIFSENYLYPFSAFSDQIKFDPAMQFYISNDVWRKMGTSYFAKDPNEISSLFNVYFDSRSTKSNFKMASDLKEIGKNILSSRFPDVLLSIDDWRNLAASDDFKEQVENKYQIYFDPQSILVLLKSK
jgi:hypothetical protein